MGVLRLLWRFVGVVSEAVGWARHGIGASVRSRRALVVENVALRQQVAMLRRRTPRVVVRNRDRWFWIGLRRWYSGWSGLLAVLEPSTVVRWHRAGFRAYWRWRSRGRDGRPALHRKIATLARRMADENPTWGAPRIHAELAKLGFDVSERTVSRYLSKSRKPPGTRLQRERWKGFLRNHAPDICAMDFVTVPTAQFRTLYVWFVIAHDRRRVIDVGVTAAPRAAWVANRLRGAFPWETSPKYLISDNDPVFGAEAQAALHGMGVCAKKTAPRSPWQNGVAERWAGTLRRELLDQVIPLSPKHLERLVREYVAYYNADRCHLSLSKDAPEPRAADPGPVDGEVVALPGVGGLHHRYVRRKAG